MTRGSATKIIFRPRCCAVALGVLCTTASSNALTASTAVSQCTSSAWLRVWATPPPLLPRALWLAGGTSLCTLRARHRTENGVVLGKCGLKSSGGSMDSAAPNTPRQTDLGSSEVKVTRGLVNKEVCLRRS